MVEQNQNSQLTSLLPQDEDEPMAEDQSQATWNQIGTQHYDGRAIKVNPASTYGFLTSFKL